MDPNFSFGTRGSSIHRPRSSETDIPGIRQLNQLEWFWIENLFKASFWLTFALFFFRSGIFLVSVTRLPRCWLKTNTWLSHFAALRLSLQVQPGCQVSWGKSFHNVYHPNVGYLQDGMTILHRTSTLYVFGISERIWIHLANLMDIRCEDFICLDPVRLKSEGVGIHEQSNWNTSLPNAWCQWLHWSVARGSTVCLYTRSK